MPFRFRLEKVLARNPRQLDALALRAAIAYVKGDTGTFDRELRSALQINPAFADFYRVAGDLAARNYRFDEAVALTRKFTTFLVAAPGVSS